jgi:serine/threonine protein kinase
MTSVTKEKEILTYVAKVADALHALHETGIVHRDLKPANIIDKAGQGPVLIDFGIAHFPLMKSGASSEILGTPQYMAPEQALGEPIDARTDLYALGVIAYEWLTGSPPLNLESLEIDELQRQIRETVPRPLSQIRPDVSPAAEKLVMALLEKSPSKRPSSAADVAQLIQEMAENP